jgi:hypothetical protein
MAGRKAGYALTLTGQCAVYVSKETARMEAAGYGWERVWKGQKQKMEEEDPEKKAKEAEEMKRKRGGGL